MQRVERSAVSHRAAVRPRGVGDSGAAAYGRGNDGLGQLGNGTTTSSTTPVAVGGGLTFAAVNASTGSFTCGLTRGGAAYCWGAKDQLGTGSREQSSVPVAVAGGHSFGGLSTGHDPTCALTANGTAYCWGYNEFEQLSTGAYHSCGLTKNGAAYCWGYNDDGELGDGSYAQPSGTPVAVSGGFTFAAVSAGGFNACGITTSSALYCWGYNGAGELGIGSTTGPEVCYPDMPAYMEPCSTVPVTVSGGLKFDVVSVGDYYSCGITTAGAAYCWGGNFYGQPGPGPTTSSTGPA